MFVHWGLYSVIGHQEWLMESEGIPIPQYERLARHFQPKPGCAREWARLAKRADEQGRGEALAEGEDRVDRAGRRLAEQRRAWIAALGPG